MKAGFEKSGDQFKDCEYLFFGQKSRKDMRDTVKTIERGEMEKCELPEGYLEAVEDVELLMVHLCPVT